MNRQNPYSPSPTDKYSEVDSHNDAASPILQNSAKKKGIASLIIGILLLFFLTFGQLVIYFPFSEFSHYSKGTPLDYLLLLCELLPFALVIGIIGIVLGAKSRKAMRTGNSIGKAGLVISIIATAIIAVCFILILSVLIHTTLTWGQR